MPKVIEVFEKLTNGLEIVHDDLATRVKALEGSFELLQPATERYLERLERRGEQDDVD